MTGQPQVEIYLVFLGGITVTLLGTIMPLWLALLLVVSVWVTAITMERIQRKRTAARVQRKHDQAFWLDYIAKHGL